MTAGADRPDFWWHVGYAKAGSTFLQEVFAQSADISYTNLRPAWRVLVPVHEFEYDRAAAAAIVADARGDGDRPVVASHERLAGSPHSGHYDQFTIARRLRDLVPDSGVLVVVRDQVDYVVSAYRQYIRAGGTLHVAEYLDQRWDGRVPRFRLGAYEFDRVYDAYAEIFGEARVVMQRFELLRADEGEFVHGIRESTGLPLSTEPIGVRKLGLTEEAARVRRRDNLVDATITSSLRDPRTLPAGTVVGSFDDTGDLRAAVAEAVGDRYDESNRRLDALLAR